MRNWKYIFLGLGLVFSLLVLFLTNLPDSKLHLIACDVGQGDATLITLGKTQMLIDGGPNSKVLDCLGRHIPFWDRTIEAVILTHPDADHYTGLIEVVRRYEVENYFNNGGDSSNQSYQVLEKEVGGRGIPTYTIIKGKSIRYRKIYLDILSPEGQENEGDNNDNSLVIDLKYGSFEAILTGDAPKEILNKISVKEPIDYIKISHHGSKTGTDGYTLDNLMPKLAVISVGKNNYGHPNTEVLKVLEERKIQTLRTDEEGDIVVISDMTDSFSILHNPSPFQLFLGD